MTDEAGLSRRDFLRGAAGATATAGAAAGTASASGSSSGSSSGGGTKEVLVGPGGSLTFEPETVKVTPGTTVKWVWKSDGHNVVVESQPEGANWKGHEPLEDTGFTYSHTFETLGEYEYYCAPHKSAGMVGTVEVVESIETPEPTGPAVSDSAKMLGLATSFAMVVTLGLAFFFLKYGGDYEAPEE